MTIEEKYNASEEVVLRLVASPGNGQKPILQTQTWESSTCVSKPWIQYGCLAPLDAL